MNKALIRDSLYNGFRVNTQAPGKTQYGRGALVGVVSTLMACNGWDFEETARWVGRTIAEMERANDERFDWHIVPESWLDDIDTAYCQRMKELDND